MLQQQRYKRNEIIDEESESRMISSMIEIALEPKSRGWMVNSNGSAIQRKIIINKRPIYRGFAKNVSNVTMEEIYDCYKAGYKEEQEDIMYFIDDDHQIMYTPPQGDESISSICIDCQFMNVRFKRMNYKYSTNIRYNVMGLVECDIPTSHPLYIKPPKNCLRMKAECHAEIYWQRVGASDNEYMFVGIRGQVHFGGLFIDDSFQSDMVKEHIDDIHKFRISVPQRLQLRKQRGYKRMKSILISFMENESKQNDEETKYQRRKRKKCKQCKATKKKAKYLKLKLCSRCKKVRYCSRKCQKISWKYKHREQCK